MFSAHSANSNEPLLRPVFKWQDRARRSLWLLVWMFVFRLIPPPFHDLRCALLRLFGAKLGKMNFIYPSARIWAPWLLETEDLVTIGRGAEIYNPGGVYLGYRTIISQDAYLCGATHDYQTAAFTFISKPIRTESNVWICARAIVLPGVLCRAGSVLGAAALTSKDLEPWTIYGGNPALPIRQRNRFDLPANAKIAVART
jgi:putative colanic acid biosynthesis acetyltransferase WcaF